MYTLIILVNGIFIGWNLPQPLWVKTFQDNVVGLVQSLLDKNSNRP